MSTAADMLVGDVDDHLLLVMMLHGCLTVGSLNTLLHVSLSLL